GPGRGLRQWAAAPLWVGGAPAEARGGGGRFLLRARLGGLGASAPRRIPRPSPGSPDPPRPLPDSSAPASSLLPGRHSCRSGHTGHGSAAPVTAWPPRIAAVGVVALCSPATPVQVVGPGDPGHALALTPDDSVTNVGAPPQMTP